MNETNKVPAEKHNGVKREERLIFKCLVTKKNPSREEVMRIANHERFKQNLYMVGNMCRVELTQISDCLSVFTVFNFYYIDELSFTERIRHLLCKLRAAALRKMGASEVVVVVA